MFWTRFKAYASVKGFLLAIQETEDPDMPADEATVLDPKDADEKCQIDAKKRNALAVASFTMAFTTTTLMMLVHRAATSDWPGGLAWKIVVGLFKRYRPKDNITHVELRIKLNQVSMQDSDEPDKLFEQLNAIQEAYESSGKQVDVHDLQAIVFTVAPKQYQPVLSAVQLEKGNALSLDDLETAMNQVYCQMTAAKKITGDGKELSLATVDHSNKECWNCGEKGHIAKDCPKKKKNGGRGKGKGSGKGKDKCGICGKPHPTENCWSKPENANKCPKWYTEQMASEVNAAAVQNSDKIVEVMLCGMEFPKEYKILLDPNVWIADSGTSVHNTPNAVGLKNIKKMDGADNGLTMGNGVAEKTSAVGNLSGVMCDKSGNQLGKAMLQDVQVVPNGRFNLFSTTKMQLQGWKLGGDDKKIWLEKGDNKVVFDIVIPTKRGAVFAMYFKRSVGSEEIAGVGHDMPMPVKKAHGLLGHSNENATRKTAKALGWSLSWGELGVCEACAEAKAKQKNLPARDENTSNAKESNERVYLDISTIKVPQNIKAKVSLPVWQIIVDEYSGMKISNFFKTKDGMVEPTCVMLDSWKKNNMPVKII